MSSKHSLIIVILITLTMGRSINADEIVSKPSLLNRCRSVLKSFSSLINNFGNDSEFVEGVTYPLVVILKGLQLNVSRLTPESTVASLGEGFSPLLPFLLESGVKAQGIDIIYTPQATVSITDKTYKNALVDRSAISTGLPDNSYDFVLSHRLVNMLNLKANIKVINEALRIVKPYGGEVRLYGYGPKYLAAINQYLQSAYVGQISYHFEKIEQEWTDSSGKLNQKGGWLFVAKKATETLRLRPTTIPEEMDPYVRLKM